MGFHTLCSWFSKFSSVENVEEVVDPTSSKMLSRTIKERHTSHRLGDKLSLDAELMSSKSSWTKTVLPSSTVLANFSWCQTPSVFVVVLAYMLHRYCRGRWGHTCPIGTPTIRCRVTHPISEHVLFPQRHLVTTFFTEPTLIGKEESAKESIFLSNVPTSSCHT